MHAPDPWIGERTADGDVHVYAHGTLICIVKDPGSAALILVAPELADYARRHVRADAETRAGRLIEFVDGGARRPSAGR